MKPIINPELVMIRAQLPKQLANLAQINPNKALELLQHWGNGTKPLRELTALASEVTEYANHG